LFLFIVSYLFMDT